ncbi:NADH dehydrogenase subunit B [Thermofilum adornatum]|uniref:NADH dehydrogenase subunit B n=2 Tax=Thermofilum adornatum TaxID=1365176 RepID=S6A5T9_9CREN|nr:NADH dehydrogenase subunit B [Thermofilum adornatum]
MGNMSCPFGFVMVGRLEESARKATKWLVEKTPIRSLRDWAITFSLWPVHFTTSCCGAEFAAASAPRYDAERFGFLPFNSPRQTNLMVVEGTLTKKMGEAAKIVYDQMPWPKFVIAMGACAIDGGLFYNSYNIVRPKDILPVEYYIPGCPPRPEAVAQAIIMLQEKVRKGEWRKA